MKKYLYAILFSICATPAWAQCTGIFPPNSVCGNSTGSPAPPSAQLPGGFTPGITGPGSSVVGDLAVWSNTNGTGVADTSVGVFNVRIKYGAVGDGSTDNSTAITNAFAASNAFTNGIPTVYFDCNTNTTTCVYNYGGSGTSPINPTVGTTILCAPGVTLNYTGTAHAMDIGASGRTTIDANRYTIQGCRFTGGASYTAGIYINTFIIQTSIIFNNFFQYGNRTGYNIVYNGNNWDALVMGNAWYDHDGVTRNVIDAHTAVNSDLRFTSNLMECQTASPGDSACSLSTIGVGLWVFTADIDNNIIQFHQPLVRISSCQTCGGGGGVHISNNHLEGATGGAGATAPAISFGDPGTAGVHVNNGGIIVDRNFVFWPMAANTSIVGPESASSGSFSLDSGYWNANIFASGPSGSGFYINTNQGVTNFVVGNRNPSSQLLEPVAFPNFIDSFAQQKGYFVTPTVNPAGAPFNPGNLPQWTTSPAPGAPLAFTIATYHAVSIPRLCPNTTASGTAQVCNTNPSTDFTSGSNLTPVAGDQIIYTTNTTNTGSLTININSAGAVTVKKNGGTTNLAAGDLQVNTPYLLTYDGTNWNTTLGWGKASQLTALTFSTLPTGVAGMQAYITDGLAANCADTTCTTFGTNVTGGTGALKLLVWFNGTNWTLIGK